MSRSGNQESDSLTPDDFRSDDPIRKDDERRHDPRLASNKTISIMPCDRDWNEGFHQVQLFDCSVHGIGILCAFTLEAGERFLAKLRLGEKMLLSVYKSRYCTQVGGKHQVGAVFSGFIGQVEDNPDEVLKALLGTLATETK
jgi:hypothetical protein